MELTSDGSVESRSSGRRAPDWAKEIVVYQAALHREKLALLAVAAVRASLAERLLAMHEPSRQRRVNAAEVIGLVSWLRSRRAPSLEGVLAALDRLKLNIFWWNALREEAEKDRSSAGEEWRQRRARLAQVAEPLLMAGLPIVQRFVSEHPKPETREAVQSDGIIGLYRALERFDPNRNSSFPRYAAYWVRNEIATGALRSRVISVTGHSQRKVRMNEARGTDGEDALPGLGLHLFSLDSTGAAIDPDEDASTLHEVLPDSKVEPSSIEGKELVQEWLEILRDCPAALRPFLTLRYYYPVWKVAANCAHRGAEVFEALAPMARERLIAGASPARAPDPTHRV